MLERDAVVSTMSAQLAQTLGMRIVAGEFRPGDSLPVEAELCRLFGVSRSTVREAVQRLVARRMLDVGPKLGTRVLPFAAWNLLDPDVLTWRLRTQFDAAIVRDLFELRGCFEPRAAALAAEFGHADDHAHIARRLGALEEAFATPDLAAAAEAEFHLAVMAATRNGLFVSLGTSIRTALRVSFSVMAGRGVVPRHDLSFYRAVVAPITAREPEHAAAAMRRLLDVARQRQLEATADAA